MNRGDETKRAPDFLIVGAQKCGTTSLHRHLAAHPDIYMPGAKELEFFSSDERFERGLDWYLDTYFEAGRSAAVRGEASTHYMMRVPEVPERIHDTLPDVKLIAILRNPIERAYSHFRMSVMRGQESREFEEAIEACLALPEDAPPDVQHDYVRFGEYGRILGAYLDRFPASRIHVVLTEDLARAPAETVAGVYRYLGVDPTYRPDTLEKRFNVGGEARFPGAMEQLRRTVGRARRIPGVGELLTQERYEAFKFWTRTELGIASKEDRGPSDVVRRRLARHYRPDVARLERELDVQVSWPEV
ncbi:MAG: sulfotransferase [Myxococcota bacterium]|nr:sulfotransferase [Myxococcota bacterium]